MSLKRVARNIYEHVTNVYTDYFVIIKGLRVARAETLEKAEEKRNEILKYYYLRGLLK